MRHFSTAVLGRDVHCGLLAARLEQMRANFIELLGSRFAPMRADQARCVNVPALLVTGWRSPVLFHRLTDRLVKLLPHAERSKFLAHCI